MIVSLKYNCNLLDSINLFIFRIKIFKKYSLLGEGENKVFCPSRFKIVKGVGKSIYPLVAFDSALRDAGIGDYNLVKVSSILPADCKYTDDIEMTKGSILYAAYATTTISAGQTAGVGVAVAKAKSFKENGVIFENTDLSDPAEALKQMCINAMDNREREIDYINICTHTICGEENLYVSAIAAVVMW